MTLSSGHEHDTRCGPIQLFALEEITKAAYAEVSADTLIKGGSVYRQVVAQFGQKRTLRLYRHPSGIHRCDERGSTKTWHRSVLILLPCCAPRILHTPVDPPYANPRKIKSVPRSRHPIAGHTVPRPWGCMSRRGLAAVQNAPGNLFCALDT